MRRKPLKSALRGLLAAAVSLCALLCALPLQEVCAEAPRYIVKYKGSSAHFDLVSERELRRSERAGLLEWWEPDGDCLLLGSVSPYYDDAQWNLGMIGADAVFRSGCLGQGVRVGVLDSGVNPHPDLEGRLLPGHNYTEGAKDPEDSSDSFGHGTRIAGLIAGSGANGRIGVAPGAEIVPLKVTDGKSVRISAVCAAIYGGIDDFGCRVLNLSMGVQNDYYSLREAVDYAEACGVTIVSAVGNGGTKSVYYPAEYETVIGVGAVNDTGAVYFNSNHNESVFLSAPGAEVRSTDYRGGYILSSGTSFAVPQVTGAAAVLLSIDSSLSPAALRALLAECASDAGTEGYDEYYGHGILNLSGCVAALCSGMSGRVGLLPESGPATSVVNGTDTDLDCVYLLARYDALGRCLGVTEQRLHVPAGEPAGLPAPPAEGAFAQFLCSAEDLRPLMPCRISG